MRALAGALATLLLLLAACGEDDGVQPQGRVPAVASALTVTADPDGRGPERARTASVRCTPDGTSAPCVELARLPREAWRPVPRDRACTQQYGGAQTARIVGRHRGARVDARFRRTNGCEIARWDALAPVIALTGVRAA